MKQKIKPRGTLLAALDIGSHKIACFIGRVTDDQGTIEILGVGYQAAKGIKGGTVIDLEAAEAAIRQTVHAAENMAADVMKGYPLREVIINVPGVYALSHIMSAEIQVHGHDITDNDVRRALAKAQDQVLSADYELIHTIPIGYRIDGREGIRDPRGMVGKMLNVGIHMVTAEVGPLQNMASCIERSHLDIAAVCSSPYAAGLASIVEDEMDLGCTVIDMGAGMTSLAVFQGGSMIYSDSIPAGGWHVTNDIARGLTCASADAERIKTLYGNAIASGTDDSDLIDVPQMGDTDRHSANHIPRSLLVGIIQPRIEEILEMVSAKLTDSGLGAQVGKRVILTGGASQLPGLRDLAQTVLGKQVRQGRPIRLSSLPDAVSGPAFATTAGLLHYLTERSGEMPADIMATVEPGSLWERVKGWWKENW
jgi:cell division protein FtsA